MVYLNEEIGKRKERNIRLEKELKDSVKSNTPREFSENILVNLKNEKEFTLVLDKEFIEKYNLWEWFENYKKEAMVSTGGIRGPQNILYPWDTRFPINMVGMAIVTLGKSMVAKDLYGDRVIEKLEGCEVRYNSKEYVELISRVQAAYGIKTNNFKNRDPVPIWLVSFLIFKLDMYGGEFVTSSHAISTKTATKDLNSEGSQYIPEESMKFIEKVEMILNKAVKGKYEIKFSAKKDSNITEDLMEKLENGLNLYVEYLKNGIATPGNIELIKNMEKKIIVECVGGCIYTNQKYLLEKLGIADKFEFINTEIDPFFHGIGKTEWNPFTKKKGYYDYSCDVSIPEVQLTLGYEYLLLDKPIGTVIEVCDPDADRLLIGQVEPKERESKLKELGIRYIELDKDRLVTFYTPNQSFFLTMDFVMKSLKKGGLWDSHPRVLLTTTASSLAWVEWARANNIKVVMTPVGFKELALIMRKIEKQIKENPGQEVKIMDIFGDTINLGIDPRLVFAGEESGGMIIGPEELIKSKSGRIAIAMREKSDGEAIIVVSALVGHLEKENKFLSEYFEDILNENGIRMRMDALYQNILYDENNPDPISMKKEKDVGEKIRDMNDNFFLSLCFGLQDGLLTIEDVKTILSEAMPGLSFSHLKDVKFCGDGTIFYFDDLYVEIRKSGTDARLKSYGMGINKQDCIKYAKAFACFNGEKPERFKKKIPDDFYNKVFDRGMQYYLNFLRNGF